MTQTRADVRPMQPQVSSRVEQERSQRRRRDDLGIGRLRNLAVDGNVDPNFVYRWVNDDPGRVHQLTKLDDYDVVTEEMLGTRHEKDKGVGTAVERIVDKVTGKRAVLLRKKREYWEDDQRKKQSFVDSSEQLMRQGRTKGPDGLAEQEGQNAYIPDGGISIRTGSGGYSP